jgi:hypothetical protein
MRGGERGRRGGEKVEKKQGSPTLLFHKVGYLLTLLLQFFLLFTEGLTDFTGHHQIGILLQVSFVWFWIRWCPAHGVGMSEGFHPDQDVGMRIRRVTHLIIIAFITAILDKLCLRETFIKAF